MALRKTISKTGKSVVYTDIGAIKNGEQSVQFSAYIKVEKIEGNKEIVNATISFEGENQQLVKVYSVPVSVDFDAPNYVKQVYLYLKTLPEFAGAVDC